MAHREWISTLVRPNSKLCRLRVNAFDSSVLLAECKSLKELTKGGPDVGFKPAEALGNLYTLFSELKSKLPKNESVGVNQKEEYLLRHDRNTGAFVKVSKAVENIKLAESHPGSPQGTNFYDLHMSYNMTRPNEESRAPPQSTRWIPIDVNLITPYHQETGRAPGLFPPPRPKVFDDGDNKTSRGRGRRGKGGRQVRGSGKFRAK